MSRLLPPARRPARNGSGGRPGGRRKPQAPGVDPGTKITFPPSLAGTTLTRSNGSTYEYTAPNGMEHHGRRL